MINFSSLIGFINGSYDPASSFITKQSDWVNLSSTSLTCKYYDSGYVQWDTYSGTANITSSSSIRGLIINQSFNDSSYSLWIIGAFTYSGTTFTLNTSRTRTIGPQVSSTVSGYGYASGIGLTFSLSNDSKTLILTADGFTCTYSSLRFIYLY